MENIIEQIKCKLTSIILLALSKAVQEGELPAAECDIIIERPREKQHGDYATTLPMQLAKMAGKPPRVIADILIKHFDYSDSYVESASIAGPGYINFTLNKRWLIDALSIVEKKGSDYGRQNIGCGKKVMVEFVSANPTGPMHMGNARGGALGDALAALYDYTGYDVGREFYLNDAGNQIEKLAKSLEARYIQLLRGENAIIFPEDGYQGKDIIFHMENFIAQHGDKYLDVDGELRRKAFVDYVLAINIAQLRSDLDRYRIQYDVWFSESSLYESGDVENTIEALKKSDFAYEKEDALWFKSTAFGAEKDDVLVRNNGIPTYFAVDIAYHRNKFVTRGFDRVINIWGADHHGHVARMKGAMQAIGIDPARLTIIIMQLVRLVQDNEIVRMSKRTGEMVTLRDLLEDTGVDAARFFFNMRQADSHLEFDIDLAAKQSNDNPVFYVQYAHARICSILRLLSEEGIAEKPCGEIDFSLLFGTQEETALMERIASFPQEIMQAAADMEPFKITRYAMDLASDFHSFYNVCKVKGDDVALMHARLKLISAVRITLAGALSILSVTAPERM